jgi:hypothetical protein
MGFSSMGEAATFTVASTADAGAGSLRDAINLANANPGADRIDFNTVAMGAGTVRPSTGEEYWHIKPLSNLPALNDNTGGTTIWGDVNNNGTPDIEVWGEGIRTIGIEISTEENQVVGLILSCFLEDQVRILPTVPAGGGSNKVQRCYIGARAEGLKAGFNQSVGVHIKDDNVGVNIIGRDMDGVNDDLEDNLVSGGDYMIGIWIQNSGNNIVWGNIVGLNVNGDAPLEGDQSMTVGVRIESAWDNIVGYDGIGDDNLKRNIISWNGVHMPGKGVEIITNSISNRVSGNYIGTDIAGANALGNRIGVIVSGSDENFIGTNSDGIGDGDEGNLISGNNGNGIELTSHASQNLIAGNFVGTDVSGTLAIPNGSDGIYLSQATDNLIGFNASFALGTGARNVISGNGKDGVAISYLHLGYSGCSRNIIGGNFIGVDCTGLSPLPNSENGIAISRANLNLIGSDGDGDSDEWERNVVSANSENGIIISACDSNAVSGNYIGVGSDGTTVLGNAEAGVLILGRYCISRGVPAFYNIVGRGFFWLGPCTTLGNVIANNGLEGVGVADDREAEALYHRISRNSFYDNGGLAIDLERDGVTANDLGDPDNGPNTLLNFPVIQGITRIVGGYQVWGKDCAPNGEVELYVSDPDPSGHGEGRTYLLTTIADGSGDFDVNVLGGLAGGDEVTALCINTEDNTSEFSGSEPAAVEDNKSLAPRHYGLKIRHSNPCPGNVAVSYYLNKPSMATLKIFDIKGSLMQTLVNEEKEPGQYAVQWNTEDVVPGVYFIRFRTEKRMLSRKLLIVQ